MGLKEQIGPKALRIGIFHYTTLEEVDAILGALHEVSG
jgi:selenocysteine lyase/cysteine desulfurase